MALGKNNSLPSTNNNIKQHTNTKQTFQTHMIMKIRENVFCSPKEQQRHKAKLIMPNGIVKQKHEAKISRRKPQRTRLPPYPLRYSSAKGMLVSVTSPSQECHQLAESLSHSVNDYWHLTLFFKCPCQRFAWIGVKALPQEPALPPSQRPWGP